MPLVGTAGHVDHGKSTLILALSGKDPDRWAEEKERGLTIDLGFAWADLGDGTEVSFVDVPGHERYLKNMLAGIEAIDVALLVVAANEGWMPQTEEHVAVLDLLNVTNGVVALTKTDLVDAETVELAILETGDHLVGTSLQSANIVPISAISHDGLGRLRQELSNQIGLSSRRGGHRSHMWVDRAFTVPGTGTVVTGSLLGGELSVGDQVTIFPKGNAARVRTLQSHETTAPQLQPGRRVAVGLSGVDLDEIGRGDLLAREEWRVSSRFVATYRLARYIEELPTKGAFQLHIGSRTANIRILKASSERLLIDVAEDIPLVMGERFILRDTGRRLVIAGGQVLDPSPSRLSFGADLDPALRPAERANQLLDLRNQARLGDLRIDSDGGIPDTGFVINETAVTAEFISVLSDRVATAVSEEHRNRPLRKGLAVATLTERVGADQMLVELAVEQNESLEMRGPDVGFKTHHPKLEPASQTDWERAREHLSGGLEAADIEQLGLAPDVVHFLVRNGELVRVSDNLLFLPSQIKMIVDRVSELHSPFGVGDVKESLGLSRKYVVPILEWLDSNHYTLRRGDSRVAGPALRSS